MTGGRVVIIGKTGRNFAAGMSGGIAYIYDREHNFHLRCNLDMVALEQLNADDLATVRTLLSNHWHYTKSPVAKSILDDAQNQMKRFIKVIPLEYKRILESVNLEKKLDLAEVSDG
jgi:glutamate synthase domain-containing protein 3